MKQIFLILVSLLMFNSMNSQSMLDILNHRKPDTITLKGKKIEYWELSSKEFKYLKENMEMISIKQFDEDLECYDVDGLCLVIEGSNVSIFKNIKDVMFISQNYEGPQSYDPTIDFNPLGEKFLNLASFDNSELKSLIHLDLDYSVDSLDDLDEYINGLSQPQDFIYTNRLLLLAYLGNTIIKNYDPDLYWSIIDQNGDGHWKPILHNKAFDKEIDITIWYIDFIEHEEAHIMGFRGLYSVLITRI